MVTELGTRECNADAVTTAQSTVLEDAWRGDVRAAIAGCTRVSLDDAVDHVRAAIAAGASPRHAGDLALALAVGLGDVVAIRRFTGLVAGDIATAARTVDSAPSFVDEVAQRTQVRVVVGDTATAPRITHYRGKGPLRAWVAVAAHRIALNLRREARPHVADYDVLADVVDREPDLQLRHLKKLYRVEFREALAAALTGLADRSRAVLRLRFVDGLELAHIGKVYRVHESTASRWIATALEDVARATRKQLVTRLAVTAATADSVARMVHSQLDVSIARLLG
jgi:RNA polymerase sigma-70 factor (ECF subfamily)